MVLLGAGRNYYGGAFLGWDVGFAAVILPRYVALPGMEGLGSGQRLVGEELQVEIMLLVSDAGMLETASLEFDVR